MNKLDYLEYFVCVKFTTNKINDHQNDSFEDNEMTTLIVVIPSSTPFQSFKIRRDLRVLKF